MWCDNTNLRLVQLTTCTRVVLGDYAYYNDVPQYDINTQQRVTTKCTPTIRVKFVLYYYVHDM